MDAGARAQVPAVVLSVMVVLPACGGQGGAATSWDSKEALKGVPVVENTETGATDLDTVWTASVATRIGTRLAEGPESFGSIFDLAVDELGRIWVLARQAKEVRVFGPGGTHVRTVGGEGQGPGELSDPIGVDAAPGGQIWVLDPGNGRVTVFDTAGHHLGAFRKRGNGYSTAWRGGIDAGGRYYALAHMGDKFRLLRYRADSVLTATDTLRVPERTKERPNFGLTTDGARYSAPVPFTPSATWDLTADGHLVASPGTPYEIRWLTPDHEVLRAARRPWEPRPVTAEARKRGLRELDWFRERGGEVDPSRIPDEKPAVHSLFVEPSGRVWVDPYDEDERDGDRTFDVFERDGRYLGAFTLPVPIETRPRPVFRDDRLYAVHRDEVGVGHVVVVHLVRSSQQDKS